MYRVLRNKSKFGTITCEFIVTIVTLKQDTVLLLLVMFFPCLDFMCVALIILLTLIGLDSALELVSLSYSATSKDGLNWIRINYIVYIYRNL